MRGTYGKKFRKGAASFYVVAFSTLILLIISASFATVIISEMTRTSNDDLAQSAYDSALAGVEDAKLAYYNYKNCVDQGKTAASSVASGAALDCSAIMYYMENAAGKDCDMVGHILGRIGIGESREVTVTETSSGGNNMAQAYTCVKIEGSLSDYRSTLSSSTPSKIVPVVLDNGWAAEDIKSVKISWTADTETDLNYVYYNGSKVSFPAVTTVGLGNPPAIALTLIQTGGAMFDLMDFNKTVGNRTDRGTIYLVPTGVAKSASSNSLKNTLRNYYGNDASGNPRIIGDNYISGYNGTENFITPAGFLKSNDKVSKNYPYVVYCSDSEGGEFVCSATVQLPEPIIKNEGEGRSDETFAFVVSLPYGGPTTDFAMEFCTNDKGCLTEIVAGSDGGEVRVDRAKITSQIEIDSTGRANDLYRRVETRMEPANATMAYPLFPIQLLGEEDGSSADKKLEWVTSEYGINDGVNSEYDGH